MWSCDESDVYEKALAEYKRCAKNNPKNMFAHANLAETYALAGRYEEARESWSEVKKLDEKGWTSLKMKIITHSQSGGLHWV